MNVRTIAVIGAGVVGRGVALLAARSGYQTVLEDISDVRLDAAKGWVTEKLRRTVVQTARLSNFSIAHTVEEAIRDADLIIETLPDEMEMQIELFTILDKFAKPNAIFASTGRISITELAEVTFCPDRCVGMRFGEDLEETETFALIKGSQTSRESIETCGEVAGRMGKRVVVVDDAGPERCV